MACHTYGGEGMKSCLKYGVDAPIHLLELDETDVKLMLQKLLFVPTSMIWLRSAGRSQRNRRRELASETP